MSLNGIIKLNEENEEVYVICKRRCMTTYERQKLSKIANQWFSFFQRYTEIKVVYEATVSTNTKKTSKLSWQYLQIQFYYF